MEVWKDIEGYSGYLISSNGNVKSLKTNRLLKSHRHPITGYPHLTINKTDSDLFKTVLVHRLVAKFFIPNPENKPQVNHKNCIKTDNRVENLEWVTKKENCEHAAINNLYRQGVQHHFTKLTPEEVKEIRWLYKQGGITQKSLGKTFGVTKAAIRFIIIRKNWKSVA